MAISSAADTRETWSKRKAKTPIRSLSRLPSLPSSGRSSPTPQEAVPGVMIKFVGKMTKIDDVPTFSLQILHEQRGGLHGGTSASSITDSFSSRSSTPPFLQSEQQRQLLLKMHLQKPYRPRPTSSSYNNLSACRLHRESSEGDRPNSSDDDDDDGVEAQENDHRRHGVETGARGGRRRATPASSDRASLAAKKSCSSCGTKKTPYWREGWEPSVVLCNACGIRYQKYKKYCTRCVAIARKDDKGRLHCPECRLRL